VHGWVSALFASLRAPIVRDIRKRSIWAGAGIYSIWFARLYSVQVGGKQEVRRPMQRMTYHESSHRSYRVGHADFLPVVRSSRARNHYISRRASSSFGDNALIADNFHYLPHAACLRRSAAGVCGRQDLTGRSRQCGSAAAIAPFAEREAKGNKRPEPEGDAGVMVAFA